MYFEKIGEESTLIWCEQALKLTEMREELKRILEGNVLDMSFEDDVAKDVLRAHSEALYKADEKILEADNESLKQLANILNILAECVDEATNSLPVFFEFCIPRPNKDEVEKMAIAWLKGRDEKHFQHG